MNRVDLTDNLRRAIESGKEHVYGRVNFHFGIGGHQVAAETLEEPVWQTFF